MVNIVAGAIVTIVDAVLLSLDAIHDDNKKREEFTQSFVKKAREDYPDYNVVIIHTPHDRDGQFIHQHYELPMTIGTCGYEIYFSKIGDSFSLTNNGDGGHINWAYIGYNRDGKRIWA